jgi:molecular chaperone GrpE (heat shock protein)
MGVFTNMFSWFRKKRQVEEKDKTLLDAQSELQSLRLEIQERDKTIANLKDDLNRERDGKTAQVKESTQAFIEKLIVEASTPVSQLLTQAHLLESEGKPIQAKDVISISKRFIHVFENAGMNIEGTLGEKVSFDPNYHNPLSINSEIKGGDKVVIKLVGISYQGKVIRKAGVEKCQDV